MFTRFLWSDVSLKICWGKAVSQLRILRIWSKCSIKSKINQSLRVLDNISCHKRKLLLKNSIQDHLTWKFLHSSMTKKVKTKILLFQSCSITNFDLICLFHIIRLLISSVWFGRQEYVCMIWVVLDKEIRLHTWTIPFKVKLEWHWWLGGWIDKAQNNQIKSGGSQRQW